MLDISRSAYYYKPVGNSAYNLLLMRLIDEEYTRHPFYGTLRLTAWLRREGYEVNPKRVRRLMREMGIEAVYQKPKLSTRSKKHKIWPYLLRGVSIDRPNQVWSTDITYIRMDRGFVYLTAIMDWFSRYVLSWELSTTLDKQFCIEALKRALDLGKPEIFNTDQGSQFTSLDFTGYLQKNDITISMDGRGRAHDNIFIERLWRSLKYEEVYLNEYRLVNDATVGIGNWFEFYNMERVHQSLNYRVPAENYWN